MLKYISTKMEFTRYLYNKEYIEYSLFISLLNRDKDEALFWTYELYFSGYKNHTFVLLWNFYYQLYGSFFKRLENYLYRRTREWMENMDDNTIIGTIAINLASREPCIDFYFMNKKSIEYPDILKPYIERMDSQEDVLTVLNDFIKTNGCFENIAKKSYSNLICLFEKLTFLPHNTLKLACISRMFSGLFLKDTNNGLDRRFYIKLKKIDIREYETKPLIKLKGWKIAPKRCKYTIKIPPFKEQLNIQNYYDWLFYASGSPLWRTRIKKYNGFIDFDNRKIEFDYDDDLEDFYDFYDMEPDEQPREVLSKWFGIQPFNNYEEIYNKYKLQILNDWLLNNNYII